MYTSERLTKDERLQIYQWIGEGYSTREICRMFNKTRIPGTPLLRIPGVERIMNLPEAHRFVSQYRINFLKEVKQVPISEKRIRLDDLEKIRQKLSAILGNCHAHRSESELSKFMQVSKILLNVLDLARNEMEQRAGIFTPLGTIRDNELSEMTDEQLNEERKNLIARLQRTYEQRASSSNEDGEGDEGKDTTGSAEIFLAASEELRREELQSGEVKVSDV